MERCLACGSWTTDPSGWCEGCLRLARRNSSEYLAGLERAPSGVYERMVAECDTDPDGDHAR